MLLSFLLTCLGFFLSLYSLFQKREPLFTFGWLVFYFSLMVFIYFLSLTPFGETKEARQMRIFSFSLAAGILGGIFFLIFLLVHFFVFK